jgi:hypothetical protein
MGITQVKGRKVVVGHPSDKLFSLFSDMTNFSGNLPKDIQDKVELQSTTDTLIAKVMGFQVGIKVDERIPNTSIRYIQYAKSPVQFTFLVLFKAVNDVSTEFQLELEADLHGIFQMMSGKLQGMVDKVTDEIERSLGGAVV